MTDTQRVPEEMWTIYVCDECGGVGQNNLGLHLPYTAAKLRGDARECSPETVREVQVVPLTALEEERERAEEAEVAAGGLIAGKQAQEYRAEAAEKERDRLQAGLREEIERLRAYVLQLDGQREKAVAKGCLDPMAIALQAEAESSADHLQATLDRSTLPVSDGGASGLENLQTEEQSDDKSSSRPTKEEAG
jgi:hypothetical protein